MDLRSMRDAQIQEKLAGGAVQEAADYRTFVEQTAFDYKTDLDQVLYYSLGDSQYFLLTGRFNWKALIAYAQHQQGTCRNGFCRIATSKPDRHISFYPVNQNVMALAFSSNSGAAADVAAHPREKLLIEVPADPVWLHLPSAVLKDNEKLPAGTKVFARALADSEYVQLTLGPDNDRFALQMDVTCKTEEQAAILRSQLEQVTSLLKSLITRENQAPNPNDLSGILTSGSYQRVNRHVVARWPIERSFLDSLASTN
jgi:hypothetical protein